MVGRIGRGSLGSHSSTAATDAREVYSAQIRPEVRTVGDEVRSRREGIVSRYIGRQGRGGREACASTGWMLFAQPDGHSGRPCRRPAVDGDCTGA